VTVWWDSEDRGQAVYSTLSSLAEDQRFRRVAALRRLTVYRAKSTSKLSAELYSSSSSTLLDEPRYAFAASCVDTAKAKIASKQRPKPVVLTSGAGYKTRLDAKHLSKFLLGLLYQRQGQYPNCWALGEQVFKDCCIWEAGVLRVTANVPESRIDIERCFAHDIYFDHVDAEYGSPRSLFHRYRYDRDVLAKAFPQHKSAIMAAPSARSDDYSTPAFNERDHNRVELNEAYRLGERHVIAMAGERGAVTLVDEPFERENFPYVFLLWEPGQFGCWSEPLVDQCEHAQNDANETYLRIREAVRLGGGGYLDVEKGAYDNEDELASNETIKVAFRNAGRAPMNLVAPPAYSQATLNYAQITRSMVYELSGVNEMASQGQKQPGVDSGIAIRTVNDMQSERFLPKSRAYEQMYVDIGRRVLEAAKDLATAGKKPSSTIPGSGLLEKVDWDDIDPILGGCEYEVSIQAASAMQDTLASRLQFISDMQASGMLTPDAAKRMLASADPDIDSMSNRDQAQYNWIERIVGEVLESDDDDADDEMMLSVEPPDPLMNLGAAVLQMTEAYLEVSSYPDAPEWKRSLLRNWVTAAVDLLNRSKAPPAAPAGPPIGAPPPEMAPPPGPPPMGLP
jgi:hypothetical protein